MGRIISSLKAAEIASDWHKGGNSILYQFLSSGKIIEENYNRYLLEIEEQLYFADTIKKINDLRKLKKFFEFKIEKQELLHHI